MIDPRNEELEDDYRLPALRRRAELGEGVKAFDVAEFLEWAAREWAEFELREGKTDDRKPAFFD